MRSLETYVERADELAQDVIDAWNRSGSVDFTPEFTWLLHKTFLYITASERAHKQRAFDILKRDAVEERATRLAFARAYKIYFENASGNTQLK